MNESNLRDLLTRIQKGEITVQAGLGSLKNLFFTDLGFAKIDHHRELRKGFPEVIFCSGKTREQIVAIIEKMLEKEEKNLLATRATPEIFQAARALVPGAEYHEVPRLIVIRRGKQEKGGNILVVSAGTSDLPVAEEAAITAEVMGNRVERLYDVGVAGIHRLAAYQDQLFAARVVIVVAGMEGALASVIGGLVDKPVIAVPTSVGYGASFGGLAALLGMLNSCASGVSVVNIDNGFGAGFQASLINQLGG
ncbi:MAG TPA: nickel pincer cofactor biosynthesis protein LarB [Clostridia bacterium]|nr:nickel pincer cofactor biosynthesis protein LarB [Clostridia bacterium]